MTPPEPYITRLEHTLRAMDLAYTKRWVIAPMYRESSVAEHSYRVTVLAHYLHSRVRAVDNATWDDGTYLAAISHALFHDWDEHREGDVPGPAKSVQFPDYKANGIKVLVKVADAIETGTWWVLWGNRQAWGSHPFNQAPRRDIDKIMHYAALIPGLMEAATEVWAAITGNKMEDDYGVSLPSRQIP